MVELDPKQIEARHDAQVKAALKKGAVAVIFLCGAHSYQSEKKIQQRRQQVADLAARTD